MLSLVVISCTIDCTQSCFKLSNSLDSNKLYCNYNWDEIEMCNAILISMNLDNSLSKTCLLSKRFVSKVLKYSHLHFSTRIFYWCCNWSYTFMSNQAPNLKLGQTLLRSQRVLVLIAHCRPVLDTSLAPFQFWTQ